MSKRGVGDQRSVACLFKKSNAGESLGSVMQGRCETVMPTLSSESVSLIFSSPPYNIGKSYEEKRPVDDYVNDMVDVVEEIHRVLCNGGHLCWQVGNHVDSGVVSPLDIVFHPLFVRVGFVFRKRFVWTFGHGLHCQNRFSGRYETICWYTKGISSFVPHPFVSVQQEWSTFVLDIPNVKSNHVEKTKHPCQFPVELVERFVLALTEPGDLVLDPFGGSGTTAVAAVLHRRRGLVIECVSEYVQLAESRLRWLSEGRLETRPLGKAVCDPSTSGSLSLMPAGWSDILNPSLESEAASDYTAVVHDRLDNPNDISLYICLMTDNCNLTIPDDIGSTSSSLVIVFLRAHEYASCLNSAALCRVRDLGFLLRNRIIFSRRDGGYDMFFWYARKNSYFDLDSVRIPSKYPGKRSTTTGKLSCNPLGKNPSDFWEDDGSPFCVGLSTMCLVRIVRSFVPVRGYVTLCGVDGRQGADISAVILPLKRNLYIFHPD